jgi:hypothetical protein
MINTLIFAPAEGNGRCKPELILLRVMLLFIAIAFVKNRISRWEFRMAKYNQKLIRLNRKWFQLVTKYTIS